MTDPRPSGRPNHPDLHLMRQIAERIDQAYDQRGKLPNQVIRKEGADPASVLYFAEQRAASVLNLSATRSVAVLAAGTWLDGFLVGIELARRQVEEVAGGTP